MKNCGECTAAGCAWCGREQGGKCMEADVTKTKTCGNDKCNNNNPPNPGPDCWKTDFTKCPSIFLKGN